jgi:hypothetical protein
MNTLPPSLRIANTAAVLHGPYAAVTRQAALSGTSRQTLYRDAPRVVQAVDGANYRQQRHRLSQDNDRLRAERTHLSQQLQHAVVLDADQLARFAATVQAEGVSLPVARRLLWPLPQHDTPSVAQLGRWTQVAALKAEALLSVMDDMVRPQVEQVAADDIFFGRRKGRRPPRREPNALRWPPSKPVRRWKRPGPRSWTRCSCSRPRGS